MIQRIQSVFILLLIIGSALLFILPYKIYSAISPEPMLIEITMLPLFKPDAVSASVFVPALLNLDILVMSFIALFSYKNRKKQMNFMLMLMVLGVSNFLLMYGLDFFPVEDKAKVIRWPIFIPLLQILFAFLARIFIKKDDDLVRSADRLR